MDTKQIMNQFGMAQQSPEMMNALRIWKNAYENKSAWLGKTVYGLNLPASISNEIARMVTIENEIIIDGSAKADYINNSLNYFRDNEKNIIEMACAVGGMYMKPYLTGEQMNIDFIYQDEAIPFKWDSNKNITGVMFPSFIVKENARYTLLEIHDFSKKRYVIQNKAFISKERKITNIFDMQLGDEIPLTAVPEWREIEPEIIVEGVERPLYAYFKVPIANNIDRQSPLGMSVYSRAIEDIKHADIQISRLDWEIEGKETAIELDESYLKTDAYGNEVLPKNKERLYRTYIGESDKDKIFTIYSPEIRDESYINVLNKYKQEIEFKCGLAYGTISDPTDVSKTAEEVKISKQRSYQLVTDIQLSLERALNNLISAIDTLMYINGIYMDNGEVNVSYRWDDSIIVDSAVEKAQDIQDVNMGIMSRWEYRMKWYGESEDVARERVNENTIRSGLSRLYDIEE